MTLLSILLALALAALLARARFFGFAAQHPADYADTAPRFSLSDHLSGPMLCEGVIFGPTGALASRFTARMHGTWQGDTGTLSEDFTYSTGRTQQREWRLRAGPGDRVTATADDIEGEATGTLSGATLSLRYRVTLPPEAGGHRLDVTDWLYLTADGVIINRSEMRKFGFRVAELVATMRPTPDKGSSS